MEERLRSHYESLSRVIRFTRTADAKAAPLLALQVALVGTLVARFEKLFGIAWHGPWDVERGMVIALAALFFSCLASVVWLAARVYMPTNPNSGESLIFFEDVTYMGFGAFENRARNMGPNCIERQLVDQVHRVSKIASVKMCRVRRAFWWSLPATLLWLVLLGWGSI